MRSNGNFYKGRLFNDFARSHAGPTSKVKFFAAGEVSEGSREGFYYRVDEPGRKGEWLGPYREESDAEAEARQDIRDKNAHHRNDSEDDSDDWD